jgi:hypothetical protein
LSGTEQALPGPAYEIFFSNVWNALKMFNFDDGEIWVHSVPHRPALDVVSAALFALGIILVLVRYLRKRHWLDLFLLVSIPLLQLPSTLSLAFPGENPGLEPRRGGVHPGVHHRGDGARWSPHQLEGREDPDRHHVGRGGSVAVRLRLPELRSGLRSILQLVPPGIVEHVRHGAVIKEFEQTHGRTDTVWIVPYPHWVDTRLPAVWAGIPNRDLAMWRDDLATTLELTGPKLFMARANLEAPEFNDTETLDILQSLYPNGQLRMFDSDVPGHDFWIYFVPQQ